ncbi:MAG: hypothetical protein HQM08_05610 [Candidatus Riflebacteria bacterium]|nr:hypothetical protein [Candidatus Riflebacteria bacterium]
MNGKTFLIGKIIILFVFSLFINNMTLAGIIADASLYFKNREEINIHARNTISTVKELYRERRSVQRFVMSASAIIESYRAIKDKHAQLSEIASIAIAIDSLTTEYAVLSPKAEKLNNQIKPDLIFFANLQEAEEVKYDLELSGGHNKFLFRSISDYDVARLSAAAGFSKVWGSVKSDPFNFFRWVKLKDEYEYGRIEGKYALKCAQIGFETNSLYVAFKKSMDELLSIRAEIAKMLLGNVKALLGIENTIEKIRNAPQTIEAMGTIVTQGGNQVGKRFDELLDIQDLYVKIHRTYQLRYADSAKAVAASYQPENTATTISVNPQPIPIKPPTGKVNVSQALQIYQQAYQEYTKAVQNPYASQPSINRALENLKSSKYQYDQAKVKKGK